MAEIGGPTQYWSCYGGPIGGPTQPQKWSGHDVMTGVYMWQIVHVYISNDMKKVYFLPVCECVRIVGAPLV